MLLGICHPLDVLGEGCSLLGLRSLLLRRQFASWKRSNHCCRWRRGCGRCPRSALNRELWGGIRARGSADDGRFLVQIHHGDGGSHICLFHFVFCLDGLLMWILA